MITVYTKPDCPLCRATRIYLNHHKITYIERDVSVDSDAFRWVADLGYASLPVVETGTEHWSGFKIEKLAGLKAFHPGDNNGVIEHDRE